MGSITSLATSAIRSRATRAADAMRDGAQYAADAGSNTYERLGSLLDDLQATLSRAQKTSGREYDSHRPAGAEGGGYECCQQRRYRPRRDAGCRLHQVLPAWVRMHLRLRHSAEVSPRVNVT